MMARRGAELRAHILDTAKWVFLESGFERTSMDAVAARAGTSKRSLYAHFPTKDALFLSVVERIHDLFRGRLSSPDHYADEPAEATALFCGRFVQLLGWAPLLRTVRLGITEAERLPDAAAQLYEAFFGTAVQGLTAHLCAHYEVSRPEGEAVATRLLGASIFPALPQALLGIGVFDDEVPDEVRIGSDVDLAAIRRTVGLLLSTLPEASRHGAGLP